METDRRLWQRRLTDDEMAGLLAAANAAGAATPRDALESIVVGVFDIGLGEAIGSSFHAEDSVVPWQFALPLDQWKAIAEWLMSVSADDLEAANMLMVWMSVGPSAFEEESTSP